LRRWKAEEQYNADEQAGSARVTFSTGDQMMIGLILQSRALEAAVALAAAAWALLVAWKSIDYIVTMRRNRRDPGPEPDDQP
jgi:hypothetical protein